MALRHIEATWTDLPNHTTTTILADVEHVLETGDHPPEYLVVTCLSPTQSIDFLRQRSVDGTQSDSPIRPKATFNLRHATTLPQPLADVVEPLKASYADWQQETIIQKNFSQEELSLYLAVHFDTNGMPSNPELYVGFDMWGLPESGMPDIDEAIPELADCASQRIPTTLTGQHS